MPRVPAHLFQGTLDVLILKTLTLGPRHGYGIAEWLEETSERDVKVEDAALYTALHKMEAAGWVASSWGLSDKGKRAKYYELTADGRAQLRSRVREWDRYVVSITRVLRATGARLP